jgi:hypothetical protein
MLRPDPGSASWYAVSRTWSPQHRARFPQTFVASDLGMRLVQVLS